MHFSPKILFEDFLNEKLIVTRRTNKSSKVMAQFINKENMWNTIIPIKKKVHNNFMLITLNTPNIKNYGFKS